MPRENELPDSIKDLAFRNNTEIRPGRDLTDHLNRLVQGLQRLFETQAEAPYKAEKKQTLIEGSLLSQLSYTASRILSDLTSSRSASTTKDQAPGIRSGSPKQFAMPSERPVARTKIALYFVLGAILLALIYMYLDQVVMETDYGAWPLLVGATIVSIVAAIMSKHLVLAPLSCLLAIFADLILVGFLHDWQSLDLLITIPLAILCSIPSVVIVILSRRHIQHQHGPNVEVE